MSTSLYRIAVLIDWENIRKNIFEIATKKLGLKVDYNDPDNIKKFIYSFIDSNEDIYRIFLYVSAPLREVSWKGKIIDLSKEKAYQSHVAFLDKISVEELIAVRKGKLKFRGMLTNNKPDLVQKQVDMLIGLDIAHLSYNKLVDRILILCADTDIIPALKTARINGLQVVVGYCEDLGGLNREIKEHSDFIRKRDFKEIFS